jgi:hypothetical protein
MTRTARVGFALAAVLCLVATVAAAEDRQALEAELFSEAAGTTAAAEAPLLIPTPEPKTVAFSGQITGAADVQYSNTRNADSLNTFSIADLFLDVRLAQQAKVFLSLELTYLSQGSLTALALPEAFFDFNLERAAYFRTGKQVLQWGRCYLWNPTDLINVERERFIRRLGQREGAYGMKIHIPFGTTVNIYDFIDTGRAVDVESLANALKVEFLLGNLEIAFSGWGKKGYSPVWGLDLSARVFGIDTLGEISTSRGDNLARARVVEGQLETARDPEAWATRASLNLSRGFTVGDFKDRLTVMVEGYYDRTAYADNVLADPTDYPFAQPVWSPGSVVPTVHGTYQDFITLNQLYQPNYFSRAYVAVFTTFTRFILTDMALNANYIQNLVDTSGLVSAGVTYTTLNSFTAGFLANVPVGGPEREYTFQGLKYDLQLTLSLAF